MNKAFHLLITLDYVKACNYHLAALRHIRPVLSKDVASTIACSIGFALRSMARYKLWFVLYCIVSVTCNGVSEHTAGEAAQLQHWMYSVLQGTQPYHHLSVIRANHWLNQHPHLMTTRDVSYKLTLHYTVTLTPRLIRSPPSHTHC